MIRTNRTKQRLQAGQPVYGILHSLAHPQVAEMIGLAGFDFVVIDGEHGPGGAHEHLACLQAIAATPATGIVRVASGDPLVLKSVLDLGAEGVMVPNVGSAAEARAAVAACRYPPQGTRGFSAPTVRASDYGYGLARHMAEGAAELLVCVMIESAQGVRNAREIAGVRGVDVVQIGPFDLSCDLGIPGQFDHPKMRRAIKAIAAAAHAAGKFLGGVPLPGMEPKVLVAQGYRFITVGADVPLLAQALAGKLPALPETRDGKPHHVGNA